MGSSHFYVCKDGDVLDQLVTNHYGAASDISVEAVLAANDLLAANGPILPAGLRIELPAFDVIAPVEPVRLWD